MSRSGLLATAVVILATAALAVAPSGEDAEPAGTPATTAPIERAVVACPPMPLRDATASAAVVAPVLEGLSAAALEDDPVQIVAGEATLARVGRRGETWRDDTGALAGGFVARTDGALAAGLSATVTADVDSGRATAACVGPASTWWFVGAGSSVGRRGVLQLANISRGVSVVDLTVHGPAGIVEELGMDQVVMEPGSRQAVPLDDIVPGVPDVAIEVNARQGRIAAAYSETYTDGSQPGGADFLGTAAGPATEVALTGIPGGSGRRTLTVVNTGDSETVVDVEVLGATGAFAPADFKVLAVPPGAVVTRSIGDVTRAAPAGLRLTADQPISASVRNTGGSPTDVAHASAAWPLVSGGAAAIPNGVDGVLQLSASGGVAVQADVTVFDATGKAVNERSFDLVAGRTVAWPIKGQRGRPASVTVVSAEGSSLIGALRWSGTGGSSITPLLPLRVSVERPALAYDVAGP
jgi:Family of unknown function (DUF5719)